MATAHDIIALKKYVRATNYLAASQIYLKDNVLLERPLAHADIKPRLLGHWGTCPGINFVYANVNRLIKNTNADFIYIVGPGHGFPALQANLFVEGSLTHFYPEKIPYSTTGVKHICERFSAPYGYPSHSNPSAPGAILEGGELGYSLAVAYGTVLDNPDLITVCLVGDGESETGPLAAAWQVNKLLSPIDSGAVLPIIHVNGYKISGPTVFGRMSDEELTNYFSGLGYEPLIVDHDLPTDVYVQMADTMDAAYARIRAIQSKARGGEDVEKPRWPMIILKTPKGWTGTPADEHLKFEGNYASHQVIMDDVAKDDRHLELLETWLTSYGIDELLTLDGDTITFDADIRALIPPVGKSCGTQRYSRGGDIVRELQLPDLTTYAVDVKKDARGAIATSSLFAYGTVLRDAFKLNEANHNLRLFSPDETYSNQLQSVFEVTGRAWQWPKKEWDQDLSRTGRVMELLSEHTLFALLHGYTVTGRHGLFASYEAFVQVIASMADQYAKFIKASQNVAWRKPVPPVNIVLTSLLERQDHNGFSHQNPSFISSMLEKDGDIISCYLPPDANTLLVTLRKTFESRNALNLIVADKKPLPQWLTLDEAETQMKDGIMTWDFASDADPEVVLAASGDHATEESLAAIELLKIYVPAARVRFVNVSELTALGVGDPTTATNSAFLDRYFTPDRGVVFNFHGYPQTIKKLLFDYTGAHRVQVNGYVENGSTTTPFDMEVRNRTDRLHLVVDLAAKLRDGGFIAPEKFADIETSINDKLKAHHDFIIKNGVDPEEIEKWKWGKK